MNSKEMLDNLKKQGITVYSYSRIGSFNNCEYEYYNSYVLRDRGIVNCYTEIGSCIHDSLEAIYKDEKDKENLVEDFQSKMTELDVLDIRFPNEKIRGSFEADVNHFVNNFNKLDGKFKLEELIVFKTRDGHYFQGYIDAIRPSEKGKPYIDVIDWKTSSKFSGKKLDEAGRQLLMYKLGLEQITDFKVDKVMWFMIKYVYVCSKLKNGKTKKKMCNRGKWVKEIRNPIEKEMYKLGMDEFEVEMLLDKAITDNNLDCLPKEIQDKYWLEDCFVEYDATEEKIDELNDYISNTIAAINSKDHKNEDDWKPVDINNGNSFYCSVLCGQRKKCKYYKQFLKENADGFDKKDRFDVGDLFK